MQISLKELPNSRIQYGVELEETETAEFFAEALKNLAAKTTVTGFRPGKAPADVVRSQIKPEELREEAYSLAARAGWNKIAEESQVLPIEDPSVEVEKFEEGDPGKLVFSFDIRPKVTVKDWQKIRADEIPISAVTDEEVDNVITSLGRAHAQTLVKLEPAETGDKLEITFSGAINHVSKDKLAAKKFALILGQGGIVPGFEDHLVGAKRGETKKFSVRFPQDHFDKELADKTVEFEVEIDEVFRLVLPPHDAVFAEKFGHDSFDKLRLAVREDLERHKNEEAFIQRKAKWLAEFDKKVTTTVPRSLLKAEVDRSRQAWSSFLTERSINAQDWLTRRNITMEKLEEDWQKAAESSVRIGLGLAEVAKEMGKELKNDQDYQELLDELVNSPKKS